MYARDEEEPSTLETCPNCGMDDSEWSANNGRGYRKDEQAFCCEGCADGTGCICAEPAELEASETKATGSSVVKGSTSEEAETAAEEPSKESPGASKPSKKSKPSKGR